MKLEWMEIPVRMNNIELQPRKVFVDSETGRIYGEIDSRLGAFAASYENSGLGEYLKEEQATIAVEKHMELCNEIKSSIR